MKVTTHPNHQQFQHFPPFRSLHPEIESIRDIPFIILVVPSSAAQTQLGVGPISLLDHVYDAAVP
jgi:hypothetical protein